MFHSGVLNTISILWSIENNTINTIVQVKAVQVINMVVWGLLLFVITFMVQS